MAYPLKGNQNLRKYKAKNVTMNVISAVDKNQTQLVQIFRQFGASVLHLHQVGEGCPDLLIGYRGKNFLVEIKTAKGKLRDSQTEFIRKWRGKPPVVVRNREDIIDLLQSARE